ncbi:MULTISPECIES: hypothetical protein [unclassified Spirosoma]|uniref:hypothetical protein n=1 Tax=unclassified Spirosoma TaxID=2621999 RepID=UPI00095BE13B|nr:MULTISPECIES: hypothetical protein [unclassified Spirosoma]MBN8824391.1 hypothetical protein [Spirosoma sp.]OJW70146.1 MAG: hypothetical protein BGO59_26085 [Spirosoma sp. 48-14]
METNQDLFFQSNTHLFLRIDGIYYQRNNGKGWTIIREEQLPTDVIWSPLTKKLQTVFLPVLKDEGLLNG